MAQDTTTRSDDIDPPDADEHQPHRRVTSRRLHRLRIRWAALGAAVAVTLGAGGFGPSRTGSTR